MVTVTPRLLKAPVASAIQGIAKDAARDAVAMVSLSWPLAAGLAPAADEAEAMLAAGLAGAEATAGDEAVPVLGAAGDPAGAGAADPPQAVSNARTVAESLVSRCMSSSSLAPL